VSGPISLTFERGCTITITAEHAEVQQVAWCELGAAGSMGMDPAAVGTAVAALAPSLVRGCTITVATGAKKGEVESGEIIPAMDPAVPPKPTHTRLPNQPQRAVVVTATGPSATATECTPTAPAPEQHALSQRGRALTPVLALNSNDEDGSRHKTGAIARDGTPELTESEARELLAR
jgi:hypothetical protein